MARELITEVAKGGKSIKFADSEKIELCDVFCCVVRGGENEVCGPYME